MRAPATATAPVIGLMSTNGSDRRLLASFLEQSGYQVHLCTEVDLVADRLMVSLIVVDETYARRCGKTLIDLKQTLFPLYLPILVMVGMHSQAVQWLRGGFDDVLRMPLNKEVLLVRLQTFLQLRQHSVSAQEESEHFVVSTIDALSEHLCVLDFDGNILLINQAWRNFAVENGMSPATDWTKFNYISVCEAAAERGSRDALLFTEGLHAIACGMRNEFSFEYSCDSPSEKRWFLAQITRFVWKKQTVLVISHANISNTRLAENKLAHLAHYDSLTGLPNRAYFYDSLYRTLQQAKRSDWIVGILFIDLDHFKMVNDSMGHAVGDEVLMQVAARLTGCLRASDVVGRIGGDEFCVFLPALEQAQDAGLVAEKIVSVLSAPIMVNDVEAFVTASVGVSLYPNDGYDIDALVNAADTAMYRAKELGKRNYQYFTPSMNAEALERARIINGLRGALERSEFVLHYQPQIDLRTGNIVGVEALIRWQHPELGMVPPNGFIAIAEGTGLIVPIGKWALRTACKQMKVWHKAGFEHLRIAVNLSARQFGWGDLSMFVRESLEESGLPANCLDLELTESLLMADVEQTVGILESLRELGVQLSIDDFGTGYSSLAYLKRFPIDVLKIDRSFIRELPGNSNDAAIADAIISMAHSLGIRVIAEGVETEAQCEYLSRNMCDEIQGYLFSKALPALEMDALLNESRRLPEHLLRMQKPARTLLLVDDEPSILSALKRQLRQDGYQIMTANNGHAGLESLAQNKVDVIVSDQCMPGMTGVEFLRKVKALYPDTVRILLSGFTELQSVTDAVNEGAIYKFLTKPWDDNQLREHIAEAFQRKDMGDENRRLNIEVRTANQELASTNRQLEELIKYKQQQIQRREVGLDIVREALQYMPLPVIGLDEDQIVVFANIAASEMLGKGDPLLGNHIDQFIPDLAHTIPRIEIGQECVAAISGVPFDIVIRKMGQGTQSRGSLISFGRRV